MTCEEQTEQALRRVADYFKDRAKANRRFDENDYFRVVADTFDLAVTRVEEEIKTLYGLPHDITHRHDYIQGE